MKIEELYQLVDKHEIISFDIFDTLLFRNVYLPTDIFKIMDKEVAKKYNIDNFYEIRIESESESRKNVENGEVNIDEIYKVIGKKIGEKNIQKLKQLELDLEYQFIDGNPFMKKVFDYAMKKKKKVFLISDMYLKKEFISKLLKKCGYADVPLYVSCEYRAGKGNKKLFEIVQQDNNLDKDRWIHIGDSIVSDYERPLEFGIHAYRYTNIREYDKKIIPKTIEESIITSIQYNYLYNGNIIEYWNEFGTLYISPIYFGFTFWLYNLTKNKDNLFFLARDGYIIKKIYDLFPNDKGPYTSYIYGSRASLQLPSLVFNDDDKILETLTMKNNVINDEITVQKMFEVAGLECDYEKYKEIMNQFGFESFDDIVSLKNEYAAKKMIAHLLPDIKENLSRKSDLAIKYLNQEKMGEFKTINTVDVGWGGSIQYAISNLLDKKVVGYYLGTIRTADKKDLMTSTFGYYFDLNDNQKRVDSVINNVMMYELIFSAPHGTTLGYKEENNKIIPILEEDNNSQIIEKFQNASLDIIKKYLEYLPYFESIDTNFCLQRYQKFIEEKKIEDLKNFHNLENDMILGSNKKYSYVQAVTKQEILKNYRVFKEKKSQSIWKDTYIITDVEDEREYLKLQKLINRKSWLIQNAKKLAKKILPFKIRQMLRNIYQKMHKN